LKAAPKENEISKKHERKEKSGRCEKRKFYKDKYVFSGKFIRVVILF